MTAKIGVLYGTEETFPFALVDKINSMGASGATAEHIRIGGVRMGEPCPYRVIIDRVSHDIAFYRAYLKNASLGGTIVVNNPFWGSADDRFFEAALAAKIGVAVPPTVVLPHKEHPPGVTERSLRNLMFPLNWKDVFDYVGFPAVLKPFRGGGPQDVSYVQSDEDFFHAYDRSRDLCMIFQRAVHSVERFRCYVVGRENVRVMQYDPEQPQEQRYVHEQKPVRPELQERMVKDALILCRALGYDLNAVEFAVEGGVPYAVDFLNPAPEADYHMIGPDHFAWLVDAVAELAIRRALSGQQGEPDDYSWRAFLNP